MQTVVDLRRAEDNSLSRVRVLTEKGRAIVGDIARKDRSNWFTSVFRSFWTLEQHTVSIGCSMKCRHLHCIAHPYLFRHQLDEGILHNYRSRCNSADINQDRKLLKQEQDIGGELRSIVADVPAIQSGDGPIMVTNDRK